MKIVLAPQKPGIFHMSEDLRIFGKLEKGTGEPTLRIYSWEPKCISLGYSQNIEEEINLSEAKKHGWEIVKRPTGGGIVFHNTSEGTYSLIIPSSLMPRGLMPSFLKISDILLEALDSLNIKAGISTSRNDSPSNEYKNICFASAEGYEISYNGKKLIGSAQKRGKRTLLQHGSILVRNDLDPSILKVLKKPFDLETYNKQVISLEEILCREVSFNEISKILSVSFEPLLNSLPKIG